MALTLSGRNPSSMQNLRLVNLYECLRDVLTLSDSRCLPSVKLIIKKSNATCQWILPDNRSLNCNVSTAMDYRGFKLFRGMNCNLQTRASDSQTV